MDMRQWWPRLTDESRQWLIDNNGDVVDPVVAAEISVIAGGHLDDGSWSSGSGTPRLTLADSAVDRIEAIGNEEDPDAR